MTLPAAAMARAAAIDWYLLPVLELWQTSCTSLPLSIDGTDRRTGGGQTDTVPLHKRSPLEAGGVNNLTPNSNPNPNHGRDSSLTGNIYLVGANVRSPSDRQHQI